MSWVGAGFPQRPGSLQQARDAAQTRAVLDGATGSDPALDSKRQLPWDRRLGKLCQWTTRDRPGAGDPAAGSQTALCRGSLGIWPGRAMARAEIKSRICCPRGAGLERERGDGSTARDGGCGDADGRAESAGADPPARLPLAGQSAGTSTAGGFAL